MSKPPLLLVFIFIILGVIATGCIQKEASSGAIAIPEEWRRFSADKIELWLPPSFGGGQPTKGDFDLAIEGLRVTGREDLVKVAQSARGNLTLLMVDNEITNVGTIVTGGVSQAPSGMTLENFVRLNLQAVPPDLRILEQKKVTIGEGEAIKITVQIDVGLGAIKQVMFFLKSENNVAVVNYGTKAENFDRLASMFEQSAQTIRWRY